ncbi:ferritin-like domain-containing protein [Sphingomonas sp. GM_Shp_2]|uniref:ferritin-like domain-containing protein n=1 Tax=Sphingomonas sp. GM_Shp_2 TaxID=2937380 RepID=UPI00226A4C8A|nr:ferritin-like domain-containing protein [Sphingomonas sp. GM_Shp_2]
MAVETSSVDGAASRRRFLHLFGSTAVTVGALSTLSACENDGVVGAERVPVSSATPTPTGTSVPAGYVATDADRLNFMLQVHYLLAAYIERGLSGGMIAASLTFGSGAEGTVTGGRMVAINDPILIASLREVLGDIVNRIGFLRQLLGSAVMAQPAISIAGGEGSPFQAIARPNPADATPPAVFFDPYASENDFLLGATALSAIAKSAVVALAALMTETLRAPLLRFAGGVSATDSIIRNALFMRADALAATPVAGHESLFSRAAAMQQGRDQYDGPSGIDQDIGAGDSNFVNANITMSDGQGLALRRTPEQALGVLYASARSVSAGGFFPAGINGVIRQSGANTI